VKDGKEDHMGRIVYFDFAAAAILVILLFSIFFRRMFRGRVNGIFIILLFVILLNTICDILSTRDLSFISNVSTRNSFRIVISTFYFIFRISEGPLYFLFIAFLTGSWNRIKTHKFLVFVFLIPYIACLVLMIMNMILHNVFYYTGNEEYHRAGMIWLLYASGAFYLLCAFILLLRKSKMLDKEKFIALLSMFILQTLAITIQFFYPEYLLEMFSMAIMGMLVTNIVLRPEENVDFTTGARSYNAFTKDMQQIFLSEQPVSIIFVRLKNNSSLNSLLGNESYQDLLRRISGFMDSNPTDVLTQRPGREVYYMYAGLYAIVIEGKNIEPHVKLEAEKLLNTLQEPFNINQMDLDLDVAVGTVRCPEDISKWDDLITFANTFDRVTPEAEVTNYLTIAPDKQFRLTAEIDTIIGKAIANNSFVMYYQPIYSVREKSFTTAEALIRLIDDKEGMVSPGLFIPAAEKNGTIHKIGDFVIQDVCRFIEENDLKKLGLHFIEVNLSTVQCMRNTVVDRIGQCLSSHNVDPGNINLEVTETASNFVHDTIRTTIFSLHSLGLNFALDDYGTGYSNLQRVVDMPFKAIKLDKRFVDEWEHPRMRSVIQNTIRMIKDLGEEIVVEGVETKEAADWFASQGCDFIQGFYYARPMPEKEFLHFLMNQ